MLASTSRAKRWNSATAVVGAPRRSPPFAALCGWVLLCFLATTAAHAKTTLVVRDAELRLGENVYELDTNLVIELDESARNAHRRRPHDASRLRDRHQPHTQLPARRRHRIAGAELRAQLSRPEPAIPAAKPQHQRAIRLRLAGGGARPALDDPQSARYRFKPVAARCLVQRPGARACSTWEERPQRSSGCSSGPRTGARPAGGTHGRCDPEARRVGGA